MPHNDDPDNLAAPFAIHNCSVMNLRQGENDDGDSLFIGARAPYLDYTVENNLKHAPSLWKFPETEHAPVSTATLLEGFTPRYRGIRPNFPFEKGKLAEAVPPGAQMRMPYPEGTDQAYWLDLPDSDSEHGIWVSKRVHFAAFGEIAVRFEPRFVAVTNTSEQTWENGADWTVRLDRKSRLGPMNTTFGNPVDREIPLPLPEPASPARFPGTPAGRHAYDDFLGRVRPGPSETGRDHNGAPRPKAGGTLGAIHV